MVIGINTLTGDDRLLNASVEESCIAHTSMAVACTHEPGIILSNTPLKTESLYLFRYMTSLLNFTKMIEFLMLTNKIFIKKQTI